MSYYNKTTTKERIEKLDIILKAADAPVLKYLRPGLPREELYIFFKERGIYFNSSLIDMYEWHNGTQLNGNAVPEGSDIIPFGSFFSLEHLVNYRYNLFDWDEHVLKDPALYIPFMGSFESEMFLLKNDFSGEVFYFSPLIQIYGTKCFDSIDHMLDFIIECYEEKVLIIDKEHGVEALDKYYDKLSALSDKEKS